MTNAQTALKMLKDAGYKAFSFVDHTVIVTDPIQCRSGKREWIEEKEVSVNVGRGLEGVARFINERS